MLSRASTEPPGCSVPASARRNLLRQPAMPSSAITMRCGLSRSNFRMYLRAAEYVGISLCLNNFARDLMACIGPCLPPTRRIRSVSATSGEMVLGVPASPRTASMSPSSPNAWCRCTQVLRVLYGGILLQRDVVATACATAYSRSLPRGQPSFRNRWIHGSFSPSARW